jgi:hypothetical protein
LLIQQCDQKLLDEGIVASAEEITSFNLGMTQWAQGDLLNNPNLGFDTYFAAQSMREI